MNVFRSGFAAAGFAAVALFSSFSPARADLLQQELKCSAAVARNFAKLQKTILKIHTKCHAAELSGKVDDPNDCRPLTGDALADATAAKTKFVFKVAKSCKSVCNKSNDVECVSDMDCPAEHLPSITSNAEVCTGKGGQTAFNIRNLDWPGPYCDAILGHTIQDPDDIGQCIGVLSDRLIEAVDEAVYADLNGASGLDEIEQKCASSIAKGVSGALRSAYMATASCRDERRSESNEIDNPNFRFAHACSKEDPATIAAIDAALAKLGEKIDKSCDDAHIAALAGLCASGDQTPLTVADAQACLGDMVRELATEERGYTRHSWAPIGMLNITHPGSAAAYCGDGYITARREEHTGVGEECDGEDNDAACGPGSCFPPGDPYFECTCDTVPRERFVVDGNADKTDSDAGWNGASHDATHNDGFGYLSELSNCDCSEFTQATCTGTSNVDVCDVRANMAPRCSDDLNGTETCDERGDNDGTAEELDCLICDDDSINAGTWCRHPTNNIVDESICQSRCFVDATGDPVDPQTPCQNSTECGVGESCRGRCDTTITCNRMTEGSPLPLISASNPPCVMLEYKTDVVGTKNIVTGETAIGYTTRSMIQLGEVRAPCPVCGGVCVGETTNRGASCFGRCDVSATECLVDSDCPMGESCLESDDDCPDGTCSLDLRCSSGQNEGELCRPDSQTLLGLVSHECPPIPSEAISGVGLQQPFGTLTTELVEHPAGGPCSDSTWVNYDCPCPAGMSPGIPTRPNSCAGACLGGVNDGKGCGTGSGNVGGYTTCTGGLEDSLPCDSNSDCDSGLCTDNPKACTSGPVAKLNFLCVNNADCGGGVCGDPCPGGQCVPLCLAEAKCNGGGRHGDPCSSLEHCKECTAGHPDLIGMACEKNSFCDTSPPTGTGVCEPTGGVTCDLSPDPEDGMCASGPWKFRCTGAGFTTWPCTLEYGTCTSGTCAKGSGSLHGDPCVVNSDCVEIPGVPASSGCETGVDSVVGTADDNPGAGECEPRAEDCFVNNGQAEGGDTLNGQGSPSNVNINAAFCVPPNSNIAINGASGFGGPSRIRRQGQAFVNVESIP